jgi:hypothetical protein
VFKELETISLRKAELVRNCSRQRAELETDFRNLADQVAWMDKTYHTTRSILPKLKLAAPLLGLLLATRWGDVARSSGWLSKLALALKLGRKGFSIWQGFRTGWSRQAF